MSSLFAGDRTPRGCEEGTKYQGGLLPSFQYSGSTAGSEAEEKVCEGEPCARAEGELDFTEGLCSMLTLVFLCRCATLRVSGQAR